MSLRKKTITGLFWSFLSQWGKQVSQIIITTILARLLSPNDFGTLAMVTVFSNFALIFNEMGIGSALIQKQNTHDRHYHSSFWFNILVGIGLTLLFMAVSPLIAWFYKKPELKLILYVVSFNFLFSSFTIIQQTILTKEMDFKNLAIRDIIAVIFAGIVGIFLAYHGFGVWSLVYQMIAYTVSNAILLWILSSWRPKFEFAISDIKDIFHFSANLTGFNILNYFSRNIDQLLIGKFLGSEALGYYSLAYKIMLYPLQNISAVIGKVMFPAFSKIKDDLEKVRKNYLKMVKIISLITFPLMAWLFAVAPEFIEVFLGHKWIGITFLLRIFCLCGMIQSIGTTIGNILLSQGRADLQFKLQIAGVVIVVIAILVGLHGGLNGVGFMYSLQSVFWVHFTFIITNKLIKLPYSIFYAQFKESYFISFIILGAILLFKHFLYLSHLNAFIIYSFFSLITYGIILFVLKEIYFENSVLRIGLLK